MLQKYMGNVTQLYGKCVKYYMGSVLLGSDTQPIQVWRQARCLKIENRNRKQIQNTEYRKQI